MIFELAKDFHDAVESMPREHPRHRMLELLEDAIRRDIHFIDRHPTTLFQCMWNTCWWYDCPEAAGHYEEPEAGWPEEPPWVQRGQKLCDLLERGRRAREEAGTGLPWLRSLRPPPMHLGTPQEAVLRGHDKWVNAVAFSPDGSCIVSGSLDRTVRVWDAHTGAQVAVLWAQGKREPVDSVAFSHDGALIAGGCMDGTVRVWDARTGTELVVLRGHAHRMGWVEGVAFSPDGSRIVSGSLDRTARLWDTHTQGQRPPSSRVM